MPRLPMPTKKTCSGGCCFRARLRELPGLGHHARNYGGTYHIAPHTNCCTGLIAEVPSPVADSYVRGRGRLQMTSPSTRQMIEREEEQRDSSPYLECDRGLRLMAETHLLDTIGHVKERVKKRIGSWHLLPSSCHSAILKIVDNLSPCFLLFSSIDCFHPCKWFHVYPPTYFGPPMNINTAS